MAHSSRPGAARLCGGSSSGNGRRIVPEKGLVFVNNMTSKSKNRYMFVRASVAGNAILRSKRGVARSPGLPGFSRNPFREGLQMSGAGQRHLSFGGLLSHQESASRPSTGVGAEAGWTDSASLVSVVIPAY